MTRALPRKALLKSSHRAVELYQVKVFLEVARYLSFTEAAEALSLTQPAVSAKIKSLEASLGTPLFRRLGRKIELTAAGEYLLAKGPGLIDLESRLVQDIAELQRDTQNRLKIGVTTGVAHGWLPEFLFVYRQKYPGIEVNCLTFATADELHRAIAQGKVDVGFCETHLKDFDAITAATIDSFRYCLMLAWDHRLAKRDWLSLRELTSEFWVFPAADTLEGTTLTARLSELGMQMAAFPNREIVPSSHLMTPFLSQGHYLGFASSLQFQAERKAKLLKAIPLQEFPLALELFMLHPRRQPQRSRFEKGRKGLKQPVDHLIQLIVDRTGKPTVPAKVTPAKEISPPPDLPSPLSDPVYLQSPQFSQQRSAESQTMAIAIGTQNKTIQTVTAGIIIQRLGLLEHFLPRTGRYTHIHYDIQWQDFTSGAPIVQGLQSAQLDIGVLGDYPLLLSGVAPADAAAPVAKTRLVSFVASNPDGAGNTVIVPNRSPIQQLDDLRSRVIAVPFSSAAHGMIMRTLARENLLPEVTLRAIDNLSIHSLTSRNLRADGYAYFAPLHDIASHQGQFRRLPSTHAEQLPTFHGIVVRESLAEQHPDIVVAYLKALLAAQYWYETTPNALALVSNWVSLDPKIVAKTLDGGRAEAEGLFCPGTQIRADWLADHIEQLSMISGHEALGRLDLATWIQPELLEMAIASL